MSLKATHEPITVWIPKAQRAELRRRVLEDSRPWHQRAKNPADLVREAIDRFLAPKDPPTSAKQDAAAKGRVLASSRAAALPASARDTLALHLQRKGTSDESVCGLADLREEYLTQHAPNATCSKCRSIVVANEAALSKRARPRQTEIPGTRRGKPTTRASSKRKAGKR